MRKSTFIGVGLALGLVVAGIGAVTVTSAQPYQGMGPGWGMMDGYGPGYGPGYGHGWMHGGPGYGPGMMGPGWGMRGGYGPGYGGPGMMGPGWGRGGYGPGMMGPGYGPGMMGPGYGARADVNLSIDDVKNYLERWLAWRGNARLKVGEVKEKDGNTIVADIVTKDNSLVQRFEVDKRTGQYRPDGG